MLGRFRFGCLFLAEAVMLVPTAAPRSAGADEPARGEKDGDEARPARAGDLNRLGMEVAALKILVSLSLDRAQMARMADLARGEAAESKGRKPAKVSSRCRNTLELLHDALVDNDTDGIKYLSDRIDAMREEGDCELDDNVEISDAARRQALAALRLLTPRQVAAYLAAYEDALPDPVTRMWNTLNDARDAKGKDWDSARDEAAADVGWLVGGLQPAPSRKFADQARELLDDAHKIKAADLRQQRPELEKRFRDQLLANVSPTTVLAHVVQHDLAELLSNPELPQAIKALQTKGEK